MAFEDEIPEGAVIEDQGERQVRGVAVHRDDNGLHAQILDNEGGSIIFTLNTETGFFDITGYRLPDGSLADWAGGTPVPVPQLMAMFLAIIGTPEENDVRGTDPELAMLGGFKPNGPLQ